MSKRSRTSAGFTLLELSVVMFIMAILLGISLPRFSNFFEINLEKETQKIAKIIDNLRLQAIMKNENYRLVFDTKDSEYSIYLIDGADPTINHPLEGYSNPIRLASPVEFVSISADSEAVTTSRFGAEKLEFDKIFGQQYDFQIDSSGFIDLFTLKLKDAQHSITLQVKNIMGEITISHVVPL